MDGTDVTSSFKPKIVFIGDSGVGKSSILGRLVDDAYIDRNLPTIGVDFRQKLIMLEGKTPISTIFWDTAGQERFNSITTSFYRASDAVVFVYDVTNPESFENLNNWMTSLKQISGTKPKIQMILGNKCDSYNKFVDYDKAHAFAQATNIPFFEVSAKHGTNVKTAFHSLIEALADLNVKETKKAEFQVIELDDEALIKQEKTSVFCCQCKLW